MNQTKTVVVRRRLKKKFRVGLKVIFALVVMCPVVNLLKPSYAYTEPVEELAVNMVDIPEVVEEPEEEYVEPEVQRVNVSCSSSSVKTYMSYRAITDKSSTQYKYIRDYMEVQDDGLLRDSDRNIGVALGSHFGPIGSKYEVVLDTGITFNVVKIDEKADRHVNNGCQHKSDGSVIEFVVDPTLMPKASNGYVYSGNFNNSKQFNGKIEAMYKID